MKWVYEFGPLAEGKKVSSVLVNDKKAKYTSQKSGDSEWVWVEDISGAANTIEVKY